MKLWHDDIRRPPDDTWTWARTNREAIWLMLDSINEGRPFQIISLDHDLGYENASPDSPSAPYMRGSSPDGDGMDLVKAMCALRLVPPCVVIHSMNHRAALDMASYIESFSRSEGGITEVVVRPYEIVRDMPDLTDAWIEHG